VPTFKLGNAAVHAIATSAAPLTGVWYGQLMKPSFVFDVKTHDTIAALPAGMETICSHRKIAQGEFLGLNP